MHVAMLTSARQLAGLFAALALAGALSGCDVEFFASEGEPEPAAEAQYRAVYRANAKAIASINTSLDACNVGGSQEGCYYASQRMIAALEKFLADLRSTRVPSRYRQADASVRQALEMSIAALERRNRGLVTNNNADFIDGNAAMKEAARLLEESHDQFPPDARP
jgi:hypothetical protein